ncbi:MAG: helix-turn-helix transcriptional regulator [Phototrophicaceae bacterium]
MMMKISQQISLLIEHGRDNCGQKLSLADVARVTGIRYQTLSNLINGSSSNPRLNTLRTLSKLYDTSLDYFDCENEDACLELLKRQIVDMSDNIQEIDLETSSLSGKGKRNVLAIMEWIRRATKGL